MSALKKKKKIKSIDDIVFNMINEDTVKRLVRDKIIVLPKKKMSVPKDKRWNMKQLTSRLLKGRLSGDSIPKIAERLMAIIGNNEASAIRNARTMTTSAECHGRLDSYSNLSSQGVIQKKVWIATPDDRTRPSHINIDGEEQEINDLFSNGCMYPGDGNGPPEEVWMCRCSMRDHIIGFRRADGSISYIKSERDTTMHESQMAEERERRSGNNK